MILNPFYELQVVARGQPRALNPLRHVGDVVVLAIVEDFKDLIHDLIYASPHVTSHIDIDV